MLLRLSQPDAAPPASGLILMYPFVWTSTRTCAAPSMSTAKISLYFGLHPCGSRAMFLLDDQEDECFTKPLTLTKPFAHEYSARAQVAPQFVHPDNNRRLWRPATANRMPLKLNQSRGFEPSLQLIFPSESTCTRANSFPPDEATANMSGSGDLTLGDESNFIPVS